MQSHPFLSENRGCVCAWASARACATGLIRSSAHAHSRINSRIILFLPKNCRPKKGTAMPGFEPSTLRCLKRREFDALDRSTTMVRYKIAVFSLELFLILSFCPIFSIYFRVLSSVIYDSERYFHCH